MQLRVSHILPPSICQLNLLLMIASSLESKGINTALITNAVSSIISEGINPSSARNAQMALQIARVETDATATVRVVDDSVIAF